MCATAAERLKQGFVQGGANAAAGGLRRCIDAHFHGRTISGFGFELLRAGVTEDFLTAAGNHTLIHGLVELGEPGYALPDGEGPTFRERNAEGWAIQTERITAHVQKAA